ncbi:hypothetical protein [Aureimonas sp. AU22]|uniref:hypothetical protein n=1 Tax=Aureimonas sp. AU22 TaxID=1638162 RepID=UPI0007063A16|nr:hypothetical protein [Aureimonas sp. AU22]BAT30091.1 beta-glucosidase [Aureimonas sp. AU22]
MSIPIWAGFECGHLGWSDHDLLVTTRHLPDDRMAEHYAIVRAHGLCRGRDGLPWRHDPAPRMRLAEASGMEITWDLAHFDRPPDPAAHAVAVAQAADPDRPLHLCPVNEPSIYPMLAGMAWEEAVDMAIVMGRAARDHHAKVRLLACDPINGIGERQFAAVDRLVGAGVVDTIGINSYPHTARAPLGRAILKSWRRYGLPVLVAETSWHDGHRAQRRRFPGFGKRRWLEHILAEVDWASARGAQVEGVCWYPIVDCPPWPHPGSAHRWRHGLIREDLGIDPVLSEALREHMVGPSQSAPDQLRFAF